jgi:hypothetical protein
MRTKRYVTPRDPRRKNGPVVVTRPDPDAWRDGLKLADGDPKRLTVDRDDGGVVVHNQPRR